MAMPDDTVKYNKVNMLRAKFFTGPKVNKFLK